MLRRIPLVVLTALAMVAGCTPLGENIARRTIGSASGDGTDLATASRPLADAGVTDPATRRIIARYGSVIRECAVQDGFDWRLVLAMMKQESQFAEDAESDKGAAGLMQVMPVTQRELAGKLRIADTLHPATNIRMGVYYLHQLYGMFSGASEADRLKLTLASYNAGLGRVYDAQEVAAYLGDDPGRWQCIREALPLLSKRYSSLHRHVWEQDRPRSGWFGNSRETVAYVDSVMTHYEGYLRDLN